MTEDKARKRAVRARMAKTGESYTAARRHVAEPHQKPQPPAADRASLPPEAELGAADDAVRRGSGKGWAEWIEILDRWDATGHTHAEIARHLREQHGVPGWWAQSVTVGYERARGMRARYEHADGFAVTVSKTFPVDAARLFAWFTDARRRRRWLGPAVLRVRTSTPAKSARFDYGDDGSRVNVFFTPKGDAKATVHVEHARLADADAVEAARAAWKQRLGALARLVSEQTGTGGLPEELADALAARGSARAAWDALSPSHRSEYADWVGEAKRPATRRKRASEAVDMIAGTRSG